MTQQFRVDINNDNIQEPDETFIVFIDQSSLPNGVIVGEPSEITVTIVDDDGECAYCHVLVSI